MSDAPETDAEFCEAVESANSSSAKRIEELERERDEWKAKFIQQNKDLGCELRDPNGTIWDHAASLEHERDELIHAASALREAKGRFHTQQAAERLFKLIP